MVTSQKKLLMIVIYGQSFLSVHLGIPYLFRPNKTVVMKGNIQVTNGQREP